MVCAGLLIAAPLALVLGDGPEAGSTGEPDGVFTGGVHGTDGGTGRAGAAAGLATENSGTPAPPAGHQRAGGDGSGGDGSGGGTTGGLAVAGGGIPGGGTQQSAAGQQPPAGQPAPSAQNPPPTDPCLCRTVTTTVCSLPGVSTLLCDAQGGKLVPA